MTKAIAASNDNGAKPKRARLELPNFTATLFAESIKMADAADGKLYIALQGCEMTLPNGVTAKRTVMCFDDAATVVRETILATKDVVATLAYNGSTMKMVGLVVDGEMTMFAEAPAAPAGLDKAA